MTKPNRAIPDCTIYVDDLAQHFISGDALMGLPLRRAMDKLTAGQLNKLCRLAHAKVSELRATAK